MNEGPSGWTVEEDAGWSRGRWMIERHAGSAGHLHRLPEPDAPRRTARVLEVDRAAIVLGSSQREPVLDKVRVESTGVDVVRRNSGGGVVLLRPGAQAWIDFLVPAGDPLWHDDVVVAAFWAGEAWARAIRSLGSRLAEVHRGGQVKTEWSHLVCFSGLGPGEVTIQGRKVVGLSQRRTRLWTRIQTTAFTHLAPDETVELLALSPSERDAVSTALLQSAASLPAPVEEIVTAVLANLPR